MILVNLEAWHWKHLGFDRLEFPTFEQRRVTRTLVLTFQQELARRCRLKAFPSVRPGLA